MEGELSVVKNSVICLNNSKIGREFSLSIDFCEFCASWLLAGVNWLDSVDSVFFFTDLMAVEVCRPDLSILWLITPSLFLCFKCLWMTSLHGPLDILGERLLVVVYLNWYCQARYFLEEHLPLFDAFLWHKNKKLILYHDDILQQLWK